MDGRLSVGNTNVCSLQGSKWRHGAKQANALATTSTMPQQGKITFLLLSSSIMVTVPPTLGGNCDCLGVGDLQLVSIQDPYLSLSLFIYPLYQ